MKNEFIPYKQALALKELGFDEPCFAVYIDKTLIMEDDWLYSTNQDTFIESNNITAPLYQQAFRWFREKYGLHSTITSISQESWQWHITKPSESLGKLYGEDFYTYEETELACLQKLIEITKIK